MTSMPQDGTRRSLGTTLKETLSSSRNKDPQSQEEAISQIKGLKEEQKKKEWADWVNEEYTKCKNSRSSFEKQWYINLAFTNGKHYVAPINVPGQGFKLTSPKAPSWRVRLVINKIRVAVRTECAKLSSSKPIPTVIPSTTEDEDFSAARVAEQLLKSAFAHQEFERTYRSWIWWGSVTGVSFLKSYWDSNADDPDLQEPAEPFVGIDGRPVIDPETGEPHMRPAEQVKGTIKIERITPFHIFVPDLLEEDLNKQPYIIHAMTRSPLWVEQKFGIKATPDTMAANTIMDSAMLLTKGGEVHLDAVLVKEVWLKKYAHKDFPEGGLLTVINDKVVQHKEDWPWPFEEFPFYKYDGIPTGSFYSDSIVVDLIPLNKEYNKTKSQMIEIKNTMGKPKLLYAKGSVNPRQISSEPGQGIPYTPGYEKPQVLEAAEVPATMGIELDRLTQDFDDLSGQHEISRGSTPPQVTSGTAIAYLQEQDDTKLAYQVASIEGAIELLGKHYLKYVSTYWKEPRLIKVVGKNSDMEARHWKGSDLRGNTDVQVQSGSALPVSKAAKQAMITEYMTNGWLDPTTGFEILDLGGFDKVMDEMLVDKKQAQRENMKMSELTEEQMALTMKPPEGMDEEMAQQAGWSPKPPVPVNSFDNHEAHIQFHNMFRKTQEYELLEPKIKSAFELHVQTHTIVLQGGAMEGQAGPVGTQDPEMQEGEEQQPSEEQMQAEQEAEQQKQEQELESHAQGMQKGDQEMQNKQEKHDQEMEIRRQHAMDQARKEKAESKKTNKT